MQTYLKKVEEIVFKQKYIVRPTHLVDLFDLHIKQAQFILESFADEHKNDLIVKYGLIGYQNEPDDEIGARRFVMVERDDVENEKKNFTKLISCSIKSIKDKHNALDIDYPNDKMIPTSKEELLNYQKKGFCINESIDFRQDKLDILLKRLGLSRGSSLNSKSTVSSSLASPKVEVNNKSTTKEDKSTIKPIKPETKTKNAFANWMSTPKVEVKQEKQIKHDKDDNAKSNELNNQSSQSRDDNEFVKSKKSSNKKDHKSNTKRIKRMESSEDENNDDDDMESYFDDNMDDDEPIERNGSNQLKRSKTFDSDDSDQEFNNSKENFKHKNKKQRKRIIAFADSSDESNDNLKNNTNTIERKLDAKVIDRPIDKESCKLVEEEETYIDEDGYQVTKKVKKIMKEDKADTVPVAVKKEEEAIKKKTTVEFNKPATAVDSSNKKSTAVKPTAKQAPKNQTSIMSFFKPKNQK